MAPQPVTVTSQPDSVASKENEIRELKAMVKSQGETIRSLMAQMKKILAMMAQKNGGDPKTVVEVKLPEQAQQPKTKEAQKPAERKSQTWAEVARIPTKKCEQSKKALDAAGFKPVQRQLRPEQVQERSAPVEMKPVPTAVYFGGVPRVPIGALRRALLLALSGWAALHLSFVGNSALKVLCHKPLVHRLVAVMKSHKFLHLELFDPAKPLSGGDSRLKMSREAWLRRWSYNDVNTTSPVAREWYKQQFELLTKVHPSLKVEKPAPKKNQEVSKDAETSKIGETAELTQQAVEEPETEREAKNAAPQVTRTLGAQSKEVAQASESTESSISSSESKESSKGPSSSSESAEGPWGSNQ